VDSSDTKIKVLNDIVNEVPRFISILCDNNDDITEIKRSEWGEKLVKIREDIGSEQMLLFIGPYSSGKSTFVNALLGMKGMLPTADKPCTSVVTELSFVEGGGHRGKAVGLDESVVDMDYTELIEMIDGPRGMRNVAHLHHIELFFDIEELGDDTEKTDLAALQRLNLKIVDCPGYGSPYITNEDIIDQYIEKANFTFWMSPADKFGGIAAERKLSHIRKKTVALFPVITKSDLINEVKKEQVTDDYYEHLAPLFPKSNKEPRFVSAIKWDKAMELEKLLFAAERNPKNAMTKEEKENTEKERDKLVLESGVKQIFNDMVTSGQKPNRTDAKVNSALIDLSELLGDIHGRTEKIERYWQKELQQKGWSENDQYKRLRETKSKVDSWIKTEAESVADRLETAMIEKLSDYIMQARGKVDTSKATEIIFNVWDTEINKRKNGWAEHLEAEYKAYADYLVKIDPNTTFKAPDLGNITANLGHAIKAILESLKYAGFQTLIMSGLGGALLVTAPAVAAGSIFGISLAGLGTVMSVAGIGLFAVGIFPLLPIILDKYKEKKEQYRKEMEAKLREWMKKLDFVPVIQNLLEGENEKLYESYRLQFDSDIASPGRKYEKCQEIKHEISKLKEKINMMGLKETAK